MHTHTCTHAHTQVYYHYIDVWGDVKAVGGGALDYASLNADTRVP